MEIPSFFKQVGDKEAPETMTIILVLNIYEKLRSVKSIHTCVLKQSPILLRGGGLLGPCRVDLPKKNDDWDIWTGYICPGYTRPGEFCPTSHMTEIFNLSMMETILHKIKPNINLKCGTFIPTCSFRSYSVFMKLE